MTSLVLRYVVNRKSLYNETSFLSHTRTTAVCLETALFNKFLFIIQTRGRPALPAALPARGQGSRVAKLNSKIFIMCNQCVLDAVSSKQYFKILTTRCFPYSIQRVTLLASLAEIPEIEVYLSQS